jgi:hypothetical protein
MEYSDALLREALPKGPPPFEYVPDEVIEEIERNLREDDFEHASLVARSVQWTYAMFAELRRGQFSWDARYPPWRRLDLDVAIGLLNADLFGAAYGLTVTIPGRRDVPDHFVIGMIAFDRLEHSFPVALQQAAVEDHSPPHPNGATSASWARCNRTQLWGIVTAGHAVGSVSGRKIGLAGGAMAQVVRSCYPVIDAAFVHTLDEPDASRLMPVRHFPAAGQRVTVGRQAGPVDRAVVRVEDNMGVVNTLKRAALLYTDQPCSPGDSGALVRATGEEDAIGIYLGSLDTPRVKGGEAGRVLSFPQAMFALDVTAYD